MVPVSRCVYLEIFIVIQKNSEQRKFEIWIV